MLICKYEGPLYLAVVPLVIMGWAQVVDGDGERAGGSLPSTCWQCLLICSLLHLSPLPSFLPSFPVLCTLPSLRSLTRDSTHALAGKAPCPNRVSNTCFALWRVSPDRRKLVLPLLHPRVPTTALTNCSCLPISP